MTCSAFRGVINWFAVHPTSMNNTNQLISGDNKGLASLMLEKEMEDNREYDASRPIGKGSFVAAFASANLGDVSPNTKGPHCMDTGLPCELEHSTCNNRTQMCVASGPGNKTKDISILFKIPIRIFKIQSCYTIRILEILINP